MRSPTRVHGEPAAVVVALVPDGAEHGPDVEGLGILGLVGQEVHRRLFRVLELVEGALELPCAGPAGARPGPPSAGSEGVVVGPGQRQGEDNQGEGSDVREVSSGFGF